MADLILYYLIKVSFNLCLFYVVYIVFLRSLTFYKLNRLYLLSIPLISVLLPFTPKQMAVFSYFPTFSLPAITVNHINGSVQADELISNPIINLEWSESLFYLWMMGLCIAVLYLIYNIISIQFLLSEASKELSSKNVFYSSRIDSPFSFLNKIVLPERVTYEKTALDYIIAHEEIHIVYRHSADLIYLRIMQSLLWFHPMIYLLMHELKSVHEYQVDKAIIMDGADNSINEYGSLLLSYNASYDSLILTHTIFNSLIKKRILMMTKMKHSSLHLSRYLSAMLLLCGLIFIYSCNTDESQIEDSGTKLEVSEEVYTIVDEMPEFIGGEEALLKYIYNEIKYPAISRENGVEGLAVVRFVVEADGSIRDREILRALDEPTSEEVMRVVGSMPNWKPGKQNGKEVAVNYNLPVRFKLE